MRTHGVPPLARIAVGPFGARASDANRAGVFRDSRSATTESVMSQPRGPSGPWARAAGHCISPRGQLGSIRCLTVQLRELWTRPICGGASAPWACDPPPRGLQQANDVPGSSTPTARTQSDVRSFRLDVWRIIIALRAATSLDLGRAALECGGGVSRASCVSLHCTAVSLGVGSPAAGRPLLRASFDRGVARCTCGTVVFHTPIATFFSFCPVNARARSCGASRKVCEQTWSPTNRRQESVS